MPVILVDPAAFTDISKVNLNLLWDPNFEC